MTTSYELGQEAYKKGINCSAHDHSFMETLKGAEVGEKTNELINWNKGFAFAREAEVRKMFPELYAN